MLIGDILVGILLTILILLFIAFPFIVIYKAVFHTTVGVGRAIGLDKKLQKWDRDRKRKK